VDLKEQFHKKEVPTGELEREATEMAIPDQEHPATARKAARQESSMDA